MRGGMNVRGRVRGWFADLRFRRLIANAGWLLGANGLSAACGLGTAILAARTLGPERYGVLALVVAYVTVAGLLVSFQAWQAIIKFGSQALIAADNRGLASLIKYGLCLDATSAVLGTVLAMVASGPLTRLLGWDAALQPLILAYCWVILFNWRGTSTGILRLFDRFDLLSFAAVLESAGRFAAIGWCVITRQPLVAYVGAYLVAGVVAQIVLAATALWVLRRQGIRGYLGAALKNARAAFPGLWDYVWTTNLNSTVRMFSRELDILVIAALTTAEVVGVFKVAKQFAQVVVKVFDPLYQSIYPELAALWARHDHRGFVSLIKRATALVGVGAAVGGLGFLVLGRWLIERVVGSAYTGAYIVALIYLAAVTVGLLTFTFQPAMLAVGLPRHSFQAQVVATGAYFLVLFPFVTALDAAGASLAYGVYYLVWAGVMWRRLHVVLGAVR